MITVLLFHFGHYFGKKLLKAVQSVHTGTAGTDKENLIRVEIELRYVCIHINFLNIIGIFLVALTFVCSRKRYIAEGACPQPSQLYHREKKR